MATKTVNTYFPYCKVVYKLDDISQNAERVKKYQQRKKATERLRTEMTDDALWDCVVAFEGYPFHTVKGLPFTYVSSEWHYRTGCRHYGGTPDAEGCVRYAVFR